MHTAASYQRWNDHVRPVELTELDKQAHKMVIAYVVARFEEAAGQSIDWRKLIEGAIFEFLQRAVLTDIKPSVFRQMALQKKEELNKWVIERLQKDIKGVGGDFADKLEQHLLVRREAQIENRILNAAHYLATLWEFKLIYSANNFIFGIDRTKDEIENQIEDHIDLIGVQKIMLGKRSYGFIDLCNQLRFQQRWSTTPRVPKTSVLGHVFLVAMLTYLASLEVGAGDARITNNFLAALFHDLPEVLTRDIISPIKKSVPGLDAIIKDYEDLQVKEKLLPLVPAAWHDEVLYFINDEFKNRIRFVDENGSLNTKTGIRAREMQKYDEVKYRPVDGRIIEICDKLAAFIEACMSLRHGIRSQDLEAAEQDLYSKYKAATVSGLDFGAVFEYFHAAAHKAASS